MSSILSAPDGWRIDYLPLPGTQAGEVSWARKTIRIDPRLPLRSRRSTLAHEIEHIRRGPTVRCFQGREEESVERAAARALINVQDLGEALAESDDLGYVAEALEVDLSLLECRLRWLHPSERAWLESRLSD